MAEEGKELLGIPTDRILRHPARLRILLGLHAEGPLSAKELSKSRIGKGIPAKNYDFHFKQLVRWGLVRSSGRTAGNGGGLRYSVTEQLTQSLLDAAALAAISEVLAGIPSELAKWLEHPYIDHIGEFVRGSGR